MPIRAALPFLLLASLVVLVGVPDARGAEEVRAQVHHDLKVEIDPASHRIAYVDRLSFPAGRDRLPGATAGSVPFDLHAGLEPTCTTEGVVCRLLDEGGEREGGADAEGALRVRTWQLVPADAGASLPDVLTLRVEGRIHHPPAAEGEEYARSFARSPGTIGPEGAVLTRATWWVPYLGEDLLSFRLEAEVPGGWDAVSQGARTGHTVERGFTRVAWTCEHPMEEVYLIAAPFTVYERPAGKAQALAYLRTPDPNLANRYLEATAQYLEMYRKLIGPYPFEKFALVENFWETGYGMPSFTLLGSQVIRLPFILHSSYPHEILHNWWGNSVYVQWETGNWCEGLTAYLADHLIREGQGRGAEYRFDTLKKYRSYVRGGRDFPLTAFRSRHSGATEAVGYGKSLMLFHMLRREIGDAAFTKGLQAFYREQRWTKASFADLARVFSEVSGRNLSSFFEAWVTRQGAPVLAIDTTLDDAGALVVEVRQTQAAAPWPLTVPVAVTYAEQDEAEVHEVRMEGREARLVLTSRSRPPVRVDLDPEFDVFRRLDASEVPATMSVLFGADRVTLVVPDEGTDPLAGAWRRFAETWAASGGGQVEIAAASALEALPADRAVWLLGSRNPWVKDLAPGLDAYSVGVDRATVHFGETSVPRRDHAWVYALPHPASEDLALGWVGTDVEAALPGLARKLPHYGKYSWLGFQGDAPDNVAKGQWTVTSSPLLVVLGRPENGAAPPRGALPAREPLARLAPVFDAERLLEDVRWFAADERKGRELGTPELDACAERIAETFRKAGLEPGGDDGTFFQTFEAEGGPGGGPVRLRNVVAVLPGRDPARAGESVVVGAHYDHLGRGWPDVRTGNEGLIHNGADDNASGVAVLLELARVLGEELQPDRSIVFVAFTAEEWGLKGSRHYVRTPSAHPADKAIACVNLDTVGRLGDGKIQVLGSGTATEWRHIAMGVGYTTGVESTCVAEDPQGSDQVSFHEIGVPAVQLFTGAHADYHRPTDDVERIDAEGLVKVATFLRETVVYLSQRPEPLTATLAGRDDAPADAPAPGAGRRVLLGTMPAFDHPGPGVRVASVVEGSPAAAAGLRPDDLVLAIDDEDLEGLRHYSAILKRHAPGDTLRLRVRRGEETIDLAVELVAR